MTCRESDCTAPIHSRGLCSHHYGKAWRNGEIENHRPEGTKTHRLSDIDPNTETGWCSACGERVAATFNSKRQGWRCSESPDAWVAATTRRKRVSEKMGYGITAHQRKVLIARHGGCWICGLTDNLVIDHCHETGIIRGVLCSRCNSGLGMFKDDQIRLRRAIKYLDAPPINKSPKAVARAC